MNITSNIEIKIPIKKNIRIDPRNLQVRFKEIHIFWNSRNNDNQQIYDSSYEGI